MMRNSRIKLTDEQKEYATNEVLAMVARSQAAGQWGLTEVYQDDKLMWIVYRRGIFVRTELQPEEE
jgi:hypothetical protein